MALIDQGRGVIIYDSLINSSLKVLDRMSELTGFRIPFVCGDIRDRVSLTAILSSGVDAVIHFAALKAVGESCAKPLDYFDNNVHGTTVPLQAVVDAGVKIWYSARLQLYMGILR